jgi:hypothetical protein
MNFRQAKKILDNDKELNLELLAQAHIEEQKRANKRRKGTPGGMQRSFDAWIKLKAREKAEEIWRQRIAKAWKRVKK